MPSGYGTYSSVAFHANTMIAVGQVAPNAVLLVGKRRLSSNNICIDEHHILYRFDNMRQFDEIFMHSNKKVCPSEKNTAYTCFYDKHTVFLRHVFGENSYKQLSVSLNGC